MAALPFEFPLLRRELLGLLRSRRSFWMLVLAVAVSSLVPLLGWTSEADSASRGTRNAEVVATFLLTQLVAVLATVTAVTAGAIAGERERGTLELLVATRLSPASIVLSKLVASLAYVVILLAASVPSVCILHLQGGVAIGGILRSYAVTFAAASVAACVSLDESAHSPRTSQATAKGLAPTVGWSLLPAIFLIALPVKMAPKTPYEGAGRFYARRRGGILAAILVGFFLLAWIGIFRLGPLVLYLFLFLRHRFLPWGISPFALIHSEVLDPAGAGDWAVYLGVVLAICTAYSWRAARRLPLEVPSPPQRDDKPLSPAAAARFRAAGRRLGRSRLVQRVLKKGSTASTLLGNPVFLREISTEMHGSAVYQLASFALPLLPFLVLVGFEIENRSTGGAARGVCAVAAVLCLLATSTAGATSMPREIAQGNLDFLRGTGLTPREILTGKLLAALHAALGFVAATATVLAIALAVDFTYMLLAALAGGATTTEAVIPAFFSVPPSLFLLLLMTAYGATAGTLASVVASRALPALLVAYGLLSVPVAVFLWPPEKALSLNPRTFLEVCIFAAVTRVLWLLACWWFERFRMRDR